MPYKTGTWFGFVVGIILIAILILGIIFLLHKLLAPPARGEVLVTIPPDATVYDIDRILAAAGVLPQGELMDAIVGSSTATSSTATTSLDGKLFPDTYCFYTSSTVDEVIQKMTDNFDVKAQPLFTARNVTGTIEEEDLIVASLIQKEVASSTDQAIVAGIIYKRLAAGYYLDIDATICYAKQQLAPTSTASCSPLTVADLKIDSPYNTYTHYGLPPTPIGNPNLGAIEAALNPATSSYLYYLSDPATGATIYAKTLAQQEVNQKKYLKD
jgi:UPF0755 protein